jgi:hypothetical protein
MDNRLKIKWLCLVFFCLGLAGMSKYAEINDFFHRIDCGDRRGWTTHVVYDVGMPICVWRENSFPFRTISGVKV